MPDTARLLFVHARPDDSLSTGATVAHYTAVLDRVAAAPHSIKGHQSAAHRRI
jgi:LmbE family N-acetylglucosaminyl deacetylase